VNRAERVQSFDEYVAARRTHLRRVAYALCHDWHRADDLVQVALEKAYRAWPRLRRAGAEDAYVRTVMFRANIDDSRRGWRRERPTDQVPERPVEHDLDEGAMSSDLLAALQSLPQMQRKVVLLRYWLDLSVAQCAEELQMSEGTVKSHASRGAAALRARLRAEAASWGPAS